MCYIPYSGKFSLVQIFAELLATALEKIFVLLIFAPSPHGDHTHIDRSAISRFIFMGARPIRENREILHHAKISRYTVCNAMLCPNPVLSLIPVADSLAYPNGPQVRL